MPARCGHRHDQAAAADAEQPPNGHRAREAEAGHECPAQKGAGEVGHAGGKQHCAVAGALQPQHFNEDEGGRGQEDEQPAVGGRGQQRIGPEGGVAQHPAPGAQQDGRAQRLRVGLGQGFGQVPPHHGQGEQGVGGQRQQGRAPAQRIGQPTADGGAQAGDHAQAGQRLGHGPRPGHGGVQIAHDGPPAHHHRAHGHPLQGAPQDEQIHAGRQGIADGGQGVQQQSGQQNGPAAPAVGQWPPEKLGAAKRQQQGAQRELPLRHAGPQGVGQRGQGGQVQVGGDGLDAQQQCQHEDGDARFGSGRDGRGAHGSILAAGSGARSAKALFYSASGCSPGAAWAKAGNCSQVATMRSMVG